MICANKGDHTYVHRSTFRSADIFISHVCLISLEGKTYGAHQSRIG